MNERKMNNNNQQHNSVLRNSNNTPNKKVNFWEALKNAHEERQERERKALPGSLFLLFCGILDLLSIGIMVISLENVIHLDYTFYIRSIIYTIIEGFIFYIVFWLIISKNICKLFMEEAELKVIHVIAIITIVICSITSSVGLTLTLNEKLNKTPAVTMFFKLEKKDFVKKEHKKKNTVTYDYYFYFKTWFDDSLFSYKATEGEYFRGSIGDIFKAKTYTGYFGYHYYKDLDLYRRVNESLFPEDTKFPLPEDEGNKILDKAKEERIKRRKEKEKEK